MTDNQITIVHADITSLNVDAIVNAANSSLLGGGGVDGAIHRRAGSALLAECRLLGGCKTGEAKITAGYQLPAKHVIHTVGPIWQDGRHAEPSLLAACYRNCMQLAALHSLRTIAFPCISTGVYGFPKALAAQIAVATIVDCLDQDGMNIEVTFCCFSATDATLYRQILTDSSNHPDHDSV